MTSGLLAAAAEAEVRVYVQDVNGLARIKYECTAGEVIRAFALDVSVDRGEIVGISEFFVGLSSATAQGYGIFPAAFRDHVAATVTMGTNANWNVSGYTPLAVVADAPADTLPGLGSNGVTLEFGALWDPAVPAAVPPATGTLCALQLSQGAMVTLAANARRGGVVTSPDGNVVTPTFLGASVVPLPEIVVEQPAGTALTNGNCTVDFGSVPTGIAAPLTFTIRNNGTAPLESIAVTTNAGDYAVTTVPAASVATGGTTTFVTTFTPAITGTHTAVLHITSNDAGRSPFNVGLTGTGVELTALPGWRQTYFGSPDNSGDGADLNDFDQDGLPNLVEFAFGMHPKQNSAGMLPGPQKIGDNIVISFTEPTGVSGITYGAEWSQTLMPGTWTAVADTGTHPQHIFSFSIGTKTSFFMRLKVTNP